MIRRRIEICGNSEEMSRRAAVLFITEAKSAIARNGKFAVVLSGGTTPAQFYSLLSTSEFNTGASWNKIHFFWTDERCVPADHPDSNYRLAYELLLSRLPVPAANIHRICGELAAAQAAARYEEQIYRFFGGQTLPAFDLVFLGVGTDGHTASIFPDYCLADHLAHVALPVYAKKPFGHRVTVTLQILNNSSMIVFLVAGKSKAAIVNHILQAGATDVPAASIAPSAGRLRWLLDREAASLLPA